MQACVEKTAYGDTPRKAAFYPLDLATELLQTSLQFETHPDQPVLLCRNFPYFH